MYSLLIVIHVIVSFFLIAVILLQAGRGGGLADTFGGSQMQDLFGTKTTSVLTKLTTLCAGIFIITCLSLAIISSHRTRSIVEGARFPRAAAARPVKPNMSEPEKAPLKAPAAKETDTTKETMPQTEAQTGEAK